MRRQIYLVHHDTYENTNAFFFDLQDAEIYLAQEANRDGSSVDEWHISVLIEGVRLKGISLTFCEDEDYDIKSLIQEIHVGSRAFPAT